MSTGTKLSIIIPSAVFVIAAVAAAVLFAFRGCEDITTPDNDEEGVAFPDEAFREYVLENFDSDGDGEISSSEAAAVIVINVDGMSIESLEGIGLFTELTELYCADNLISELDLSKNTKLVTLDCSSNALSELDISCNPQLVSLMCCYNSFSEINISGNDELLYLNINGQTSMRISEKTFPDDNFREYVFKYPGTDNDRWLTP
ncbi:MAG: hypothetical protein LUH54_02135, partial [Firmicutes bacterium]|nr:hypothetical protein [Bacillota bacterium]